MQLPGLQVGIIADDLTGASDTALQFFRVGSTASILTEAVEMPGTLESQVWSMNTESRHKEPREAIQAVRQATAMLRDFYGVENFYKKMDSTLRGHIALEAMAMLEELDADCMVVAPAYPSEGRRTVGGYQLVRGIPVEKTDASRDPLAPVRQSHIPTLLKQTLDEHLVGHIELSTVMHGAGPILIALTDQIKAGKRLVVMDACSSVDLEQVALAIEKIQSHARVIPGGSAGLALAMTKLWKSDKDPLILEHRMPETPILVLSGSNTHMTRQQIFQLQENYQYYGEGTQLELIELLPDEILGQAPMDHTITRIVENLGGQNTVVVALSLSENNYFNTLDRATELEIPANDVPFRGQSILSQIAQRVLEQVQVKLVLTGGETATQVCKTMGVKCFSVMGMAEPAIPLLLDEAHHWVVTKSGNFGSPLAIANIVHYLKQQESQSLHAS